MTQAEPFQPRILGFLCNWCSYAGADLAGVSRFQYPPSLRVIRVMCSGRVDPAFVLHAFSRGVDGVMVLGCHPGDCHYATGNYYAQNRVGVLRQLLGLAGLDPERLFLDWVSAGEGERFARFVRQFTERVQALGPLELTETLRENLAAARRAVESEQIRWLVGRKRELSEGANVYDEAVDMQAFDALLASSVENEYLRNRLLILAAGRPLSVKEMAAGMGLAPRAVLAHVVALEQAGQLGLATIEGNSPKYQRM